MKKINLFSLNTYITTYKDLYMEKHTGEEAVIMRPSIYGVRLIIDYLNWKYQTNIRMPIRTFSHVTAAGEKCDPTPTYLSLYHQTDPIYSESMTFLIPYIRHAQKEEGDFRQAYVIGDGFYHCVIMAYVKEVSLDEFSQEKVNEILIVSDSLMISHRSLDAISYHLKLPIYVHKGLDGRQADNHSCYTDALVWARDITRKDTSTGKYQVDKLLKILNKTASKIRGTNIFEYQVPEFLLKTTQRYRFLELQLSSNEPIENHSYSQNETIIHKNETLSFFRSRYSTLSNHNPSFQVSTYLLQKGYKNKAIIEVQYYINQMQSILGSMTKDEKNAYMDKAKCIQKSDGNLFNFTNEYLSHLTEKRNDFDHQALSIEESKLKNNHPPNIVTTIGLPAFKNPRLQWEMIAKYARTLAEAHEMMDEEYVQKLHATNQLFECIMVDAFYAKKFLQEQPQYFTKAEKAALEWISVAKMHQSRLMLLEAVEELFESKHERQELIYKVALLSRDQPSHLINIIKDMEDKAEKWSFLLDSFSIMYEKKWLNNSDWQYFLRAIEKRRGYECTENQLSFIEKVAQDQIPCSKNMSFNS
ncbi:MAG: hypothetical protein H2069_02045 [Legionella sp.]|nr:hypothetical protein [Legionella sp.]